LDAGSDLLYGRSLFDRPVWKELRRRAFGHRITIENGKPVTYDQLFLFLK
jgi:hypothetical protein